MAIKIGIIRTSSIGDVILAGAALDLIRRAVPEAHVVWIGRKPSLDLLAIGPLNVQTIDFPSKASRGVMRDILSQCLTCNVVIDLQTSSKTLYLKWRLRRQGVAVIEANKHKARRLLMVLRAWITGRYFTCPPSYQMSPQPQFRMMLDAVAKGLRAAGVEVKADALECAIPMIHVPGGNVDDAPTWARELGFGHWLAVAPGASFETKRAPTETFTGILKLLAKQMSGHVPGLVFTGGPEDRIAATTLIDDLNWPSPVMNLTGKLTLSQTASVLSNASGLLCNDSGLGHMSEALGKPVAVLFGPTVEGFGFAPRRSDSRAFSSRIGCRPCSRHGKSPCRYGDKLCFDGINTAHVVKHISGWYSKAHGVK